MDVGCICTDMRSIGKVIVSSKSYAGSLEVTWHLRWRITARGFRVV